MKKRFDDISINTLIGRDTVVNGDVSVNGFVRIDGKVMGSVETDGVVISSAQSAVTGNIRALDVTIGGSVRGDIKAREGIHLLESANVTGALVCKNIALDLNCIFNGKVSTK